MSCNTFQRSNGIHCYRAEGEPVKVAVIEYVPSDKEGVPAKWEVKIDRAFEREHDIDLPDLVFHTLAAAEHYVCAVEANAR